MAVAVSVLSGAEDAGLGIYAAAKALNLEFIPVVTEQYDLAIPLEYFGTQPIQILLEVINSRTFKQRVEALGGYSTERTGEILIYALKSLVCVFNQPILNIEHRGSNDHFYLLKKTERHTAQAPAQRERFHTSAFEIPCSIFDILLSHQIIYYISKRC
jgi:hypothetical protein